jgi:hypothetical protein
MGHFAGRGIKLQLSVATTMIATTVRLSLANVALQLVCDTALPCFVAGTLRQLTVDELPPNYQFPGRGACLTRPKQEP